MKKSRITLPLFVKKNCRQSVFYKNLAAISEWCHSIRSGKPLLVPKGPSEDTLGYLYLPVFVFISRDSIKKIFFSKV
jgi:hypothetical protein